MKDNCNCGTVLPENPKTECDEHCFEKIEVVYVNPETQMAYWDKEGTMPIGKFHNDKGTYFIEKV